MKAIELIKDSLLNQQRIEISDAHAEEMLKLFPELKTEVEGLPEDTVSRECVTQALVLLVFKIGQLEGKYNGRD